MLHIHHLRNATMIIETAEEVLLIDPMLGRRGTMPSFTLFRHKAKRNPIVELPESSALLTRVTHCLITHQHADHLDPTAEKFLIEKQLPVTCSVKDEKLFNKKGLKVVQTIDYWKKSSFLGGTIEGIPAKHGYGFVAIPMGNVMGFYLELPNQPSIYLSSDTIYTKEVEKVLKTYQPDISVVACGSAQLDLFGLLLMNMEDIISFVKNAPGKVIANHLEAVNHCPTTRKGFRKVLETKGLSDKVLIPMDGEVMEMG